MAKTRCGAEFAQLAQVSDEDIAAIEAALEVNTAKGMESLPAQRAAVGEVLAALRPAQRTFSSLDTPTPQAEQVAAKVRTAQPNALGQWIADKIFDLRHQPWALGTMTNAQIGEQFSRLAPVQAINLAQRKMTAVANKHMLGSHRIDLAWRALPDDTQAELGKLMLETTLTGGHVSFSPAVEATWKDKRNDHLAREDARTEAAFFDQHSRFWRMSAAARKVYADTEAALREQQAARIELAQAGIAYAYRRELGRVLNGHELAVLRGAENFNLVKGTALYESLPAKAQRVALRRVMSAVQEHAENFPAVQGPYFPLARFGEHVVVMKSADVAGLEAQVKRKREALQPLREAAMADENDGVSAQIDLLRGEIAELETRLTDMKQSSTNYSVQFFEKPHEARREETRLLALHGNTDAEIYHTIKEDYYRGIDSVTPAFFERLTSTLDNALDAGGAGSLVDARAKDAVMQSVREMYLTRAPENAALKSELRRQGIDGVKSAEMRRGFAALSQSNAWRISRLMHNHEVVDGLAELGADKSMDARLALNEYKRRAMQVMTAPKGSKMLSQVNNVSHFMYLGLSPAYFVTNIAQTWVTTMPIMAARHGMARTASALADASKQIIPMLANAAVSGAKRDGFVGLTIDIDVDKMAAALKLDAGEATLLKTLTENGALDISLRHDVGATASGETGNVMSRMLEISGVITNYPEVYNRLTTALAAYRLQRQMDGDMAGAHDKAVQYADTVIDNTHLNYSEENAPRFMRGNLQRVVFQFKRYMQGMIYLMGKHVNEGFLKDGDPAARAESRRAFAYLMGSNLAVAGVAGLPIAAPVVLLAKVIASLGWDDDDEPELLQMAYNGVKDSVGETMARALAKGLPAALLDTDVSGSIGMGNILNPIGFAKTDGKPMFGQEWWAQAVLALAGPGVALAAKWGQAAVDASHGDLGKAAAEALPRFAANPLKAYQRAEQGVRNGHGDVLISPEEFGVMSLINKGMGFESADVTDMYGDRAAFAAMQQGKKEVRSNLLKDFVRAQEGMGSLEDAQAEIAAFNERHPDDPIKRSALGAAWRDHVKAAQEMRRGVRVRPRDAGLADSLGLTE